MPIHMKIPRTKRCWRFSNLVCSKICGAAGHLTDASPKKSSGGPQVEGLREIVLMIHDLNKQGLSISAIARTVGCDRKTVRKHFDRGLEAPVYGPRAP